MYHSSSSAHDFARAHNRKVATFLPIAVLALGALALSAPQAQAQKRKGSFNLSSGLGYAFQTTTFGDGRTQSSSTKIGVVLNADYRYPVTEKISVGPAVQYWSLDGSNDTSIAGLASYALNPTSDVYLAVGSGARLGFSQAFGKNKSADKGAFYAVEYVFPNDDRIDSFGFLGVGYKF